jgi:hypothetical protein
VVCLDLDGIGTGYAGQPYEDSVDLLLTLFLSAALQVILQLVLRTEFRAAHRAFIRLARFMFFRHCFTSFREAGKLGRSLRFEFTFLVESVERH